MENRFYETSQNLEREKKIEEAPKVDEILHPSHNWVSWLRAFGWIEFTLSIIVSVLAINENSINIVTGIAIIVGAFFTLVLFSIICLMADHLYNIEVYNAKIYDEIKGLRSGYQKLIPKEPKEN